MTAPTDQRPLAGLERDLGRVRDDDRDRPRGWRDMRLEDGAANEGTSDGLRNDLGGGTNEPEPRSDDRFRKVYGAAEIAASDENGFAWSQRRRRCSGGYNRRSEMRFRDGSADEGSSKRLAYQ